MLPQGSVYRVVAALVAALAIACVSWWFTSLYYTAKISDLRAEQARSEAVANAALVRQLQAANARAESAEHQAKLAYSAAREAAQSRLASLNKAIHSEKPSSTGTKNVTFGDCVDVPVPDSVRNKLPD
jgi:uncharacterized protein HemX